MSEFKGTKSPWNIHYTDDVRMEISSEEDDRFLDVWGFNSTERMKANALLISKAPEMLELLKHFYNANRDDENWNYTACMAEAYKLIKEATTL